MAPCNSSDLETLQAMFPETSAENLEEALRRFIEELLSNCGEDANTSSKCYSSICNFFDTKRMPRLARLAPSSFKQPLTHTADNQSSGHYLHCCVLFCSSYRKCFKLF